MNRPALRPLDEVLLELRQHAQSLGRTESVSTFEADGRVLAEDIVAELQVPPQDNSSMDGYAVRVADVPAPGAVLRVTQRIPAGQHGQPLGAGEAARIFTGAPVPPARTPSSCKKTPKPRAAIRFTSNKSPPSGSGSAAPERTSPVGAPCSRAGSACTPPLWAWPRA